MVIMIMTIYYVAAYGTGGRDKRCNVSPSQALLVCLRRFPYAMTSSAVYQDKSGEDFLIFFLNLAFPQSWIKSQTDLCGPRK